MNETERDLKNDLDSESDQAEHVEEVVEEDEVEPGAAELIRERLADKLGQFYKAIKHKFSSKEAGWTVGRLEIASPNILAPIILELRGILKSANAAQPESLIEALVEYAQDEAAKGMLKEEFLLHLFDHNKVMAQSSGFKKFYKQLARGIEIEQQTAAARKEAA